jgi:hypothetical protein
MAPRVSGSRCSSTPRCSASLSRRHDDGVDRRSACAQSRRTRVVRSFCSGTRTRAPLLLPTARLRRQATDARHRSMSVNVETGWWHCHRCGSGGLLQERWPRREPRFNARRASSRRAFALGPLTHPPEPERAQEAATIEPDATARPAQPEPWRLLFERAPRASHDPGAEYLAARGISRQVAAASDARYVARWPHWVRSPNGEWVLQSSSRRVVFPVHDRIGQLVAIQGRVIDADEYGPKVITRGDLGAGVFVTCGAFQGKVLVIVEAPIDALSLATAGLPAVALCGTNVPEWLPGPWPFAESSLASTQTPQVTMRAQRRRRNSGPLAARSNAGDQVARTGTKCWWRLRPNDSGGISSEHMSPEDSPSRGLR